MLIGFSSQKPNLQTIRRIKATLRNVLVLPEDVIITVAEMKCLEEDCNPVETVIGLLDPNQPQRQFKIHKAINNLNANDLMRACMEWGYSIEEIDIVSKFNPNHI